MESLSRDILWGRLIRVSVTVIGLVIATTFRFLLDRFWVYGHHRKDGLAASRNKAEAASLAIFEERSAWHFATTQSSTE